MINYYIQTDSERGTLIHGRRGGYGLIPRLTPRMTDEKANDIFEFAKISGRTRRYKYGDFVNFVLDDEMNFVEFE